MYGRACHRVRAFNVCDIFILRCLVTGVGIIFLTLFPPRVEQWDLLTSAFVRTVLDLLTWMGA